jgi:hypothetical protein
MVQDQEQESYRGVLCNFCRQPIPLPAIVARAEAVFGNNLGEPSLEGPDKSFHIRCRACDKETSYRTSEIVEVKGVPRSRNFRPRTTSIPGAEGVFAKVANG